MGVFGTEQGRGPSSEAPRLCPQFRNEPFKYRTWKSQQGRSCSTADLPCDPAKIPPFAESQPPHLQSGMMLISTLRRNYKD